MRLRANQAGADDEKFHSSMRLSLKLPRGVSLAKALDRIVDVEKRPEMPSESEERSQHRERLLEKGTTCGLHRRRARTQPTWKSRWHRGDDVNVDGILAASSSMDIVSHMRTAAAWSAVGKKLRIAVACRRHRRRGRFCRAGEVFDAVSSHV